MAKPTTTKPPTSRLTLVPSTDARRQQAKPLGRSDAGPARTVALKVADARHHTHVVGVTGSGKSTLLINLILADIGAGRGVAVLDPKGDLINDVLGRLPSDAFGRLVLIDPAHTDAPAALNVLDTTDRTPELVVDQLVGEFARLYAAYWGPRTDDVLRSACLTLTRKPGSTLADIPLLLSNAGYRRKFTAGLSDPAGLGAFWSWYDALSDASRSQVIGPVMNKLRTVLSRSFAADLLGSSASTFSLTDILDGGILLARLPKGSSVTTPPASSAHYCCPGSGRPPPPVPTNPKTAVPTPPSTSTNATTSCTYPAASTTSSPKPAATTSRSPSPTNTSVNSPATSPTASQRTPATKSSSPSAPTTPDSWPVTLAPTSPPTTSPDLTATKPPAASSSTAATPPASPLPPSPRQPPGQALPMRPGQPPPPRAHRRRTTT